MVGESPHAAEAGQSYVLVEKPNCRHSGGTCGLKNGDFELTLSFEWLDNGRMLLALESAHALDGVLIASANQALYLGDVAMKFLIEDSGFN